MLTLTSSPVSRKYYARPTAPIRETRIAPVPATPFALGLEGDAVLVSSWMANGCAFDLTQFEGAETDHVYHLYVSRDGVLVERKGFDSIGDAKAYAWHLSTPMPIIAAAKPVARPTPRPVRKMAATTHTPSDEAWWAANSPSCRLGFYAEGAIDPTDPFNWSMPAIEFRELASAACFGEPTDLSDDANGQFGYQREGGAE